MFEWNWKHIYLLEIGKDNSKSIFQPATCLFTWVLNSIHLSLVHLNNVGVPPFNKDLERSIGLVLSTDANVILCHLPGDIFSTSPSPPVFTQPAFDMKHHAESKERPDYRNPNHVETSWPWPPTSANPNHNKSPLPWYELKGTVTFGTAKLATKFRIVGFIVGEIQ